MLVDALLESTQRHAKKQAVADQRLQLTYSRLTTLATVFRGVVDKMTQRQRVGIMLPASAAFPATLFGALWASKTVIPLNFLLSVDELKHIVDDAGLDAVIGVHHFDNLLEQLPVKSVFLEDLPLKRLALSASFRRRPSVPKVSPGDTAVLLYTSGTSAAPKGVELSYDNLLSNCRACIQAARMDSQHNFLSILPPFHVFGLTAMVLVPVVLGASVYAIPRFNPAATLKAVQEQNISIMMAIPSMYGAMLRCKSASDKALKSIYMALSGGEPLPVAVAEAFERRFGVRLLQGYGLTETSPVLSICAPHAFKDGSVGRLIADAQCRIVDESSQDVAAGTDGQIIVKGPMVMKGYFNKSKETDEVIDSQGWFQTGDRGRLDDDGYLYITGRIKEMMIIGGENVAPAEIENVLLQHQAVAEAAVIGITDPSRGEVPVAFVTLADGVDPDQINDQTLRTFTRRRLAGYKVPRRIIIADDLPKGPTGKILKRKLAEKL